MWQRSGRACNLSTGPRRSPAATRDSEGFSYQGRCRVMEAWNAYVTGGRSDWAGFPVCSIPNPGRPETAPAAILARSSLREAAHLKKLSEVGDQPFPTG